MSMIKRSTSKNAVTGVVKEKVEKDDYTYTYCCHKCRGCFPTLEAMEAHDCEKK